MSLASHIALHPTVVDVTSRIVARSAASRSDYLAHIASAATQGPLRKYLACSNLAHGFAAALTDKAALRASGRPNIGIISAYNDMLSAHQPLDDYPQWIKAAARQAGGIAQFAGGVPAMCDGVTQGRAGMELSLFSRDVIAMATGIALAHDMFDATLLLGVCDKIVPGLLIGALSFGHLPAILVPAGPMPSGLPNSEKSRIRQLFAENKASRDELLEVEAASYHGPGTCTFYGTANSNQLIVEVMGLHLPGTTFVPPGTDLRKALTEESARRAIAISQDAEFTPIGRVIDEKAIVNAVVALLATGGSTNHTMHLVAIAAAAGIELTWDDFDQLSQIVPLLAQIYPNGSADINHFQAAGGIQFLIYTLLEAGLLHRDVNTVVGHGLDHYLREPVLVDGGLVWRDGPTTSLDTTVLRPVSEPFSHNGGLKILSGKLGKAVLKVSAVAQRYRTVKAPARIFTSQDDFLTAFHNGELDRDVVVVVRGQGPRANGMPELHKLTPALGSLMDRGFSIALVTDGRMSGASGKVPAAIQVTPEAAAGGPLARLADGDWIYLDADRGILDVIIDSAEWNARPVNSPSQSQARGTGRELFNMFRANVGAADRGASIF